MTQLRGLPPDLEMHYVDNIEEAFQMKRWLSERGRDVLGLDTESTGLNPYAPGAALRLIQIGDHRTGWAIPWERWGGVAMEVLNEWEGDFAVHNLSFDAKWLNIHAKWEIPWHKMHDTMIMYNMLYPGDPASLKHITDKHIDPRASIGAKLLDGAMKEHGWGWDTIPLDYEAYWTYSALDPILAAHIWSYLRADKRYPKSYDLEMSVLRIATEMEHRGVYVDVDYCHEQSDKLEEYVETSKKWALEEYNVKLGSTQSVARFFENDLGAQIVKRTPGGAPSVDKETLGKFILSDNKSVSEFAKFLEKVRTADKVRGSYLSNFIKDQTDGILHPNIKTLRAKTGRMSITDPALQTLGKSGAHNVVRSAITGRPGQVLISSDLDQVEFRIMAHLCQDKDLIETFHEADRTGGDAFTTIGAQVYSEPDFQKSDPRRGLIKSTVYGKLFGSGVKKMAETAGVPFETMQQVSDELNAAYPGINKFQKKTEKMAENRLAADGYPYIETMVTGRRIPVEEDKLYTGVNYTIQSSAAEVFKSNLVKIDAAGLSEYLVVPVHDEVLLSAPEEDAEEVKMAVRECMTTREGWAVPLTADVEGPFVRWGDKYKK